MNLLKKVLIAIPFLVLTMVVLFIVSINLGDPKSPVAQVEAMDETGALEKYKFANFEEEADYQISHTSYSDFESFVKGLHEAWHSLDAADRYATAAVGDQMQMISSVIPESNHWKMNIEMYQMNKDFKSLKDTAYKLTSSHIELTPEERATMLSWFERELNDIYIDIRNRE